MTTTTTSSPSSDGRHAYLSSPQPLPPPLYPTLTPVDWETLFPHLTDAARRARRQCLRQFPFLDRYDLDRRDDVPFVVDDLRCLHNASTTLRLVCTFSRACACVRVCERQEADDHRSLRAGIVAEGADHVGARLLQSSVL
jgi:hypothetical protein